MANVLVNSASLQAIADAIRTKNETQETYKPEQMAEAILAIETGIDTSDATLESGGQMLSGVTAYSNGVKYTGTIASKGEADLNVNGATVNVPAGYYAANASKTVAIATQATPEISVNANGTVTASSEQSTGYVSGGTKSATHKLSATDDADFIANNIRSGKTVFGVEGTCVPLDGVTARTSADLTANNNTVTAPAGYYAEDAAKTVGAAKAAATYNVSSSNQTISAGQYLTGIQTIRAVTTENISAANIKTGVTVKVGDAGSAGRIKSVAGTFTAANTVSSGQTAAGDAQIANGYSAWVDGVEVKGSIPSKTSLTVDGNKVKAEAGYYSADAETTVGTAKSAATYNTSSSDQSISAGTYLTGAQTIKAVQTSNISAANIKTGVNVKVGDANSTGRIANVTGTFTAANTVSSGQTAAAAGQILSGYSAWVGGAEVKGSVATKSASDMTVSGATVTAPAGYYAANASKSVASGSATTPATTITKNPTISVSSAGLITASVSGTQNVTPSVSAGYVSSGTAGTITVSGSNTKQLTTKAVATITPGTTDQAIASGTYLTGAQTIKGDANLTAENIAKDVTIFGVTGTHEGGTDTSDATATAAQILSGKTAYVNGVKITGTISTYTGTVETA